MTQLTESQIAKIKRTLNYRKKRVVVEKFRPGMSINSYWSDGSRDYYTYMTTEGQILESVPQNGTPFDRANLTADTLEPGQILVQTSIFRGKPGTMRIYINEG